ncbi:acyl-CoA carboxylase epsilon subunit-like protein [Rhodococcus sp. AG1013]|uniref:acyl-CoA carboxylase subunit epsilon n=1 Tax=Rhodococcus sp. AG1013 TaxID=2183996 RepID=UPI000E0C45DB|nr:acyl-CoA carboxylase subunit epsilon [Rhodococcus sp. AG1013]RDI25710.1 acyl-CoA carboxylase epsilon subunit-like protein [Rhodococcus sp. AG1013]
MTATTREEVLADAELLDASSLEGAALAEAVAGLEPDVAAGSQGPVIKIVKGNPTDQDIAALVAVLSAAAASAGDAVSDQRPPETWGAPTRMHRVRAPFSPYSFGNPVAPRPF